MGPTGAPTGDKIKCPKCGELIPVSETLRRQLAEDARAELQKDLAHERAALVLRERELDAKAKILENSERDVEKRVTEKLIGERKKLAADALQKARGEVSTELSDLRVATVEKEQQIEKARNVEMELRKTNRQLETARQELELEVARRLDAEGQAIRDKALKDADEKHRLKDAEKDRKLNEALAINEDLRRKLEQGSQQTQGEVLELELENALRDACPNDEVAEVPKGVRGADVLHKVRNASGLYCGSILWEAKNTKNWNESWIAKLREDQQCCKADVAIIVSEVLPKNFDSFGFRDGVWITTRRFVPALVAALRKNLADLAQARRAVAGKNELVDALFKYASGPEFRQRVETIAKNFIAMKEDLEQERRLTTKRWAKRSKQLDLIIVNTSEMYGELQGLVGESVRPIPLLEDPDSDGGSDEPLTVDIAASDDETRL